MGDYKQLNRELIDVNRELKQLTATLQKEIVLMRAELMEQHRIRVETEYNCREHLLSTLAKNFMSSINEIDASVNIMELLGFKDCIPNSHTASNAAISEQSVNAGSSRRSTHLVREFRRTSAVCRQQSVVQMSPARRGHEEDAPIVEEEANDLNASYACSGSDMDLDNSLNSEDVVIDVENDHDDDDDNDKENSGANAAELDCINEASDEEEECRSEQIHQSVVQQIRRIQKPFDDLSNRILKDNKNIIEKRGKQRSEHINESENSIEMARDLELETPTRYALDMELENDLVNSVRKSLHINCNNIDTEDQENLGCNEKLTRNLVVRLQRLNKPPQIVLHAATEEDTIIPQGTENLGETTRKNGEFSLALTEFSMGNFLEASCSTPFHSFGATKKVQEAAPSEPNGNTTLFDTSTSQTSQSTRPSRRCTPRTLVEPGLRTKLRNETAQGLRRRPRSSKR